VPFAQMTLQSINSAIDQPTVDPVPYTGVQFVAIPKFQGIERLMGQHILGRVGRDDQHRRCSGRRRGADGEDAGRGLQLI
jgi:hypothetical protein